MTDNVEKIISNILGPHPKKDIDVRNNRTKKVPKKSASCKSKKDPDDDQGLAKESERED